MEGLPPMIHHSYDQPAPTGHQHRERRLPCPGKVRILCGLPPFQLLLTLPLVNISQSGLALVLNRQGRLAAQAPQLLEPGDPFDLQIEHELESLPSIHINARLARVHPHPEHWLLGFAFQENNPDLLGLMHELTLASPRDGTRQASLSSHPFA